MVAADRRGGVGYAERPGWLPEAAAGLRPQVAELRRRWWPPVSWSRWAKPLRWWIQDRVDALVYGQGTDPVPAAGALQRSELRRRHRAARHAGRRPALDGLRWAASRCRASTGRCGARRGCSTAAEELPLVVEGREVGRLLVSPWPASGSTSGRSASSTSSQRGRGGPGPRLATRRLEAASSPLVEVRMEERRMLRRDLHDGMGPRSPAGAGSGRGPATPGAVPGGTAELLAGLQAEVERRTDDVAPRPAPCSPSSSTTATWRGRSRCSPPGSPRPAWRSTSTVRGAEHLDTRHQLAVYHVAAEAVLNAYRHADAGTGGGRGRRPPGGPTALSCATTAGHLRGLRARRRAHLHA